MDKNSRRIVPPLPPHLAKAALRAKTKRILREKHIVDLKKDPVFASAYELSGHSNAGKKQKSSVWLVTINSNKAYSAMSELDKRKFKQFGDYVMSPSNFTKFLQDRTSPSNSTQHIDNLDLEHQFEVGAKMDRLHLHGLAKLTHHGFYSLRANAIRDFARKCLGYTINLQSPVSSDATQLWRQYISKSANKVSL